MGGAPRRQRRRPCRALRQETARARRRPASKASPIAAAPPRHRELVVASAALRVGEKGGGGLASAQLRLLHTPPGPPAATAGRATVRRGRVQSDDGAVERKPMSHDQPS